MRALPSLIVLTALALPASVATAGNGGAAYPGQATLNGGGTPSQATPNGGGTPSPATGTRGPALAPTTPSGQAETPAPAASTTATMLPNGKARPPAGAPAAVKRAIRAGNRLQRKDYRWGGGHTRWEDDAYDCSGASSY